MLIPLRQKYRVGGKTRYKGGERSAPRKTRKKIGYEAHVKAFGVPRKRVLVVDGLRGTGVMRDYQ